VSALTKIFVVLLVILAIIQTAGSVVWVNRTQNYEKALKAVNAKYQSKLADVTDKDAQITLLNGQKTQIQSALQKQIDAERQNVETLRSAVNERDTQIAQLNANLAQATAAQKSTGDAIAVAQKTIDSANQTIGDLRKTQLDLEKRVAEQSLAINDWTNKYEVANRQWRDATEQIAQLQSDNQKKDEIIHKAGISINSPRTINGEPLVRVEGVVRSKSNIGGVPYATISVGSADQVTKGMQFKVIDPNSHDPFLGYLIVDRVESNEAIGHLTGPRVNEVHAGVEVRTQL